MSRVVVISNRVMLPNEQKPEAAGGLAVALYDTLQETNGLWFGWSGAVTTDKNIKPLVKKDEGITYAIVDLTKKDYENYKVTSSVEIECDTLTNQLKELEINKLDYLKIDTQGAELEILKGIGEYRPLLIKVEAHFFSMYKNVPSWNKLVSFLYDLNYTLIDFKGIGNHSTRIPAEADMIFIPNFNNKIGKKLILDNKDKFISLMLIFGQLKILQVILKRFQIELKEIEKLEDNYFN